MDCWKDKKEIKYTNIYNLLLTRINKTVKRLESKLGVGFGLVSALFLGLYFVTPKMSGIELLRETAAECQEFEDKNPEEVLKSAREKLQGIVGENSGNIEITNLIRELSILEEQIKKVEDKKRYLPMLRLIGNGMQDISNANSRNFGAVLAGVYCGVASFLSFAGGCNNKENYRQ